MNQTNKLQNKKKRVIDQCKPIHQHPHAAEETSWWVLVKRRRVSLRGSSP